mmetsp:Transcript_101220/g.325231  ORF Transcript_101220/g.325231 Transcript_101220/m.325231 type:complete len:218 (+) Transcript_101220:471-1124(+)
MSSAERRRSRRSSSSMHRRAAGRYSAPVFRTRGRRPRPWRSATRRSLSWAVRPLCPPRSSTASHRPAAPRTRPPAAPKRPLQERARRWRRSRRRRSRRCRPCRTWWRAGWAARQRSSTCPCLAVPSLSVAGPPWSSSAASAATRSRASSRRSSSSSACRCSTSRPERGAKTHPSRTCPWPAPRWPCAWAWGTPSAAVERDGSHILQRWLCANIHRPP